MFLPNLKRIASSQGGPKISKLGHVTLSHAPFEPQSLNWCRNPSTHTYCRVMAESNVNAPFYGQNWQCACGVSRDRVVGGHPKPHTWNQQSQFAYSLYNFYGATTTIKGSLYGSTPIVKRFSVENFLSAVKIGPKNGGFFGNYGV